MSTVVKSAQRVMEVFEYFAEHQTPATINNLCNALGYPQSSTSALLYSLVQLGYMSYDRHERTFRPTLRIATVGSWLLNSMSEDIDLFSIMDELSRETGHTIVLGLQRDTHVLYVRVVNATNPLRFSMKAGALRPMCRTAVGQALLSVLSDDQIRATVHRINAERQDDEAPIDPIKFLEIIDAVRRKGYAMTVNAATPGTAVVAKLLPTPPDQPHLAVGIGMPSNEAVENEAKIAELLHRKIMGPQLPDGGAGLDGLSTGQEGRRSFRATDS